MFEKFRRYNQIEDLEQDFKYANIRSNDRDRRSKINIAVIDDEPFKAEYNLRNVGYKINYLGDVKDLSDVASYPIVLCDLQGVGRQMDSRKQGAFIIDELKRNHPEKFVVAYTGGAADDGITIHAQEYADFFIKKDADIEEWRDKLDQIINLLSNPIEVWRRQRQALIDYDVSTLTILKLEDAYVKSIKTQNDEPYRHFINTYKAGQDVRAIAQSLIASGIFELMKG